MEDNRFLRAYKEHKKEQEREREAIKPIYNNRFECLREPPLERPIRDTNNRFECLRENIIPQKDCRFNCLLDDGYQRQPIREPIRAPIRRPEPRESINAKMNQYRNEKKIITPAKPKLSVESEFHFPELVKINENTKSNENNSQKINSLPESKMIVNSIIVPNKTKVSTVVSINNGKVISRDVYEYSTDTNIVMVKKPNYNSWASVLKEERNETVYYNVEPEKN
jgi:hypothetical protein